MKVESKIDVLWNPNVPPEKRAELMREFQSKLSGFQQNAKGLVKQSVAASFLELFPVETRQQISDQVERLNGLKDSARFQTETLLMFAEMVLIGIKASGDKDFLDKFTKWANEWSIEKSA